MGTILVIGLLDRGRNAGSIADGLEGLGWDVVRCSGDLRIPSTKYDFHINSPFEKGGYCDGPSMGAVCSYHLQMRESRMNGKKLIGLIEAKLGRTIDIILLVQNHFLWDFTGIDKPLFYYITQGSLPEWPTGDAVIGAFYGYLDAEKMYAQFYSVENVKLKYRELCPMAVDLADYPQRPSTQSPEYDVGFKGGLTFDKGFWYSKQLYLARQFFIKFLRERSTNPYFNIRIEHSEGWEEYVQFMHKTSLGLNVGAMDINLRLFEVPALGCVLLQRAFPNIESLGLKNHYNCLLFGDEYELIKEIMWAKDHPGELEEIRLRGIGWVQSQTWAERAKIMDRVFREYEASQQLKTLILTPTSAQA